MYVCFILDNRYLSVDRDADLQQDEICGRATDLAYFNVYTLAGNVHCKLHNLYDIEITQS